MIGGDTMKVAVEYGKKDLFSGVQIKTVMKSIDDLYEYFRKTDCIPKVSKKAYNRKE